MSHADTLLQAIIAYQGDNMWEDLLYREPLQGLIDWDKLPPAGLGDDVIVTTDGETIRSHGGEWVIA